MVCRRFLSMNGIGSLHYTAVRLYSKATSRALLLVELIADLTVVAQNSHVRRDPTQ